MAKVSASILACDHTKIGEQVLEAEKAGAAYEAGSDMHPVEM